ncbi:MAG: hypothetical protein ACREPB_05880 [Arenimonas sp.]
MKITLFAILLFTSLSLTAAQDYVNIEKRLSAEQLRETGLDSLSPGQLERLNQLLRDDSKKVSEIEQLRRKDDANRTSYIGLNDQPIKSRLIGEVGGWEVDTVFELENGQKWKVLKGSMKLRKPLQSPAIIVVPGIAGRWFLQVDEDLPKARVYRID